MSSAFDADFALADDLLVEVLGGSIEISSGGSSITVDARVVDDSNDVNADTGAITEEERRAYLVRTSELVMDDGSPFEIHRGDRIREVIAGQVAVFEVLPLGNEPAVVSGDPARNTVVIYTKRVATE